MTQSNPATPRWTGRVTLTSGRTTGRFEAVEIGCHGTMRLTRRSSRSLTFALRLDPGAAAICAESASMTLSLQGSRLAARWQDALVSSNYAEGTMTRS
jgi:hypothetical protein